MDSVVGICSNKPRPHAGPSGKRSAAWWSRDVWHIESRDRARTLCGRGADGWLVIGFIEEKSAKTDANLCTHCARLPALGPTWTGGMRGQ